MARRMAVVAVTGHTEVTTFGDVAPRYVEVIVRLENAVGESAEFRVPLDEQPRVGTVIEVPDYTPADR